MNSDVDEQSEWHTADGCAWWLRDTPYTEPNGDYTAYCYLALSGTESDDVQFNDNNCAYYSDSYLCQQVVDSCDAGSEGSGTVTEQCRADICGDTDEDCCASLDWGEPQTCTESGYVPVPGGVSGYADCPQKGIYQCCEAQCRSDICGDVDSDCCASDGWGEPQ